MRPPNPDDLRAFNPHATDAIEKALTTPPPPGAHEWTWPGPVCARCGATRREIGGRHARTAYYKPGVKREFGYFDCKVD